MKELIGVQQFTELGGLSVRFDGAVKGTDVNLSSSNGLIGGSRLFLDGKPVEFAGIRIEGNAGGAFRVTLWYPAVEREP